jgi:ABC-type glutathione transport system ATPase component
VKPRRRYRAEKARRSERLGLAYEAQEKRRRRLKADIDATRGYAMRTETTASRAEAPRLKRYAKKVAKKAQARTSRRSRRSSNPVAPVDREVGAACRRARTSRSGRRVRARARARRRGRGAQAARQLRARGPGVGARAGRAQPGERARTAIAAMVAACAELLLLDEPTNHLDFASLEVLESALRDYPGAIVAVSHDRAFLDAISAARRLDVRDGALRET